MRRKVVIQILWRGEHEVQRLAGVDSVADDEGYLRRGQDPKGDRWRNKLSDDGVKVRNC